jgi:GNAT superfamily N-acetyltransferase
MSDAWMPKLKMKLTREEFERLPRHPAYKYDLIDGETLISPWPRFGHAQLKLTRFRAGSEDVAKAELRSVTAADEQALVPIFAAAFGHLQPYASLDEATCQKAARAALKQTFDGGDGPLVTDASFVAIVEAAVVGAIMVTLAPGGDASESESFVWHDEPPPGLWQQTKGQPHLTWIFVKRFEQGGGMGTQLLRQAVRVLKRQGFTTLWTTFLIGNESSVLWHWRNGFELLPGMFSKRRRWRGLA